MVDVSAYILPILALLTVTFSLSMRNWVQNAPALMLLGTWIWIFSVHAIFSSLDGVALYQSSLTANTLVTLAVIATALSFVFWRAVFGQLLAGLQNEELDAAPPPHIPLWALWLIAAYAGIAFMLMYTRASDILGTSNVFSSLQRLRLSLNYGGASWGWVVYTGLSVSVFSVYAVAGTLGQGLFRKLPVIIACALALGITIISTQRTSAFFFMIAVTFTLSKGPLPRLQTLAILSVILFVAFMSMGVLVGKVGDEYATTSEIIESGRDAFLVYLLTPLSAFNASEIWLSPPGDGAFSTRFFFSVLARLGMYEGEIQSLILDFIWVPEPTNVYTFAYQSFSDFGNAYLIYHFGLGAILGLVFAFPRRILVFRVLQGLCYYPLAMSLFQDQFVGLTSTWLQVLILLFLCHHLTPNRVGKPHAGSVRLKLAKAKIA